MTNQLPRKWGDEQQYVAAPMHVQRLESGAILPQAHLLWMTPDPLGAIAAMARMYKGIPTYSLHDITDDERREYFDDICKAKLQTPFEAVQLHFFIEGVTRSFTHQMVRQRTASYAQESLRFAVKDEAWNTVVALPPALSGTTGQDPYGAEDGTEEWQRNVWDQAVRNAEESYKHLVESGMPAEEARGLMPHAMTTRLHYCTDLKALAEHAGNRLCTQAQFEWKIVFLQMVDKIRNHMQIEETTQEHYSTRTFSPVNRHHHWQQHYIANSNLFRPVCYKTGKCEWMASFDRDCKIRDRVQAFHEHGITSDRWDEAQVTINRHGNKETIEAIRVEEWMLDPAAARRVSTGGFD